MFDGNNFLILSYQKAVVWKCGEMDPDKWKGKPTLEIIGREQSRSVLDQQEHSFKGWCYKSSQKVRHGLLRNLLDRWLLNGIDFRLSLYKDGPINSEPTNSSVFGRQGRATGQETDKLTKIPLGIMLNRDPLRMIHSMDRIQMRSVSKKVIF